MTRFNNITEILKNGLIGSFAFGFGTGFLLNNTIFLKINYKSYRIHSLPLTTGCIGLISFVCSPLLITNYFLNGVYFDKLIDKYDISVERYHQYDGNDNKYAFPSLLIINIHSKPRYYIKNNITRIYDRK